MSYTLAGKKQINKQRVLYIWKTIEGRRQTENPKAKRFSKQDALDMLIEKGHEVVLKELAPLISKQT